MVSLTSEVIDTLKSKVRGSVLTPADAGYDEARTVWNAMIDRRPAMIVRCAGAADVSPRRGVRARQRPLLAIRGGGHNIAGSALCEDGVVLDLSAMKSVRVDPEAQRAYVEPGATLGDFDSEAQAFGLATPLGINSTTGVAGLTLGGGFGWLSRKFGMTVDNLVCGGNRDRRRRNGPRERRRRTRSLLGDSRRRRQLRRGHAVRVRLHPVGPQIYGGLVVYPLEQAKDVLPKYRDFVAAMPDELTVWAVLRLAPPLPFLPPEVHGKPVIVLAIVLYRRRSKAGRRRSSAVACTSARRSANISARCLTSRGKQAFDPLLTPGARNYWKSHNLRRD